MFIFTYVFVSHWCSVPVFISRVGGVVWAWITIYDYILATFCPVRWLAANHTYNAHETVVTDDAARPITTYVKEQFFFIYVHDCGSHSLNEINTVAACAYMYSPADETGRPIMLIGAYVKKPPTLPTQ